MTKTRKIWMEKSEKGRINAKKDYDFKENVLYIFPTMRNYGSSVQEGNFILDLDKEGKVVGLEILDASKVLGVSKEFLAYSFRGLLFIEVKEGKTIKIRLKLCSKIRNREKVEEKRFEETHSSLLTPSLMECTVA